MGLLVRMKRKRLLTKAISRLLGEDDISWFIEYEANGEKGVLNVHETSRNQALRKFDMIVAAPYVITSISAI